MIYRRLCLKTWREETTWGPRHKWESSIKLDVKSERAVLVSSRACYAWPVVPILRVP